MVKKFMKENYRWGEESIVNKNALLCLVLFFLFFYFLNYLTPMSFGDDYVYSFVWQGHSEFTPLTEGAVRVSSLSDLFISQWSHYLTWSGRAVSHTIIQLFLWLGKDIFNIFNAFVSVLLIIEIYWVSHKGVITFNFNAGTLCFIASVLWIFTPGFSPVFFWLSGACNYLWTSVFLLAFLLPYVRKYYFFDEKLTEKKWFTYFMFFFGVVTGWSNENSICWIILVLCLFLFFKRNEKEFELWLVTGLIGLALGYGLLMVSPGNVARFHTEVGMSGNWFNLQLLKKNVEMLMIVFIWQCILWFFNLHSLNNVVLSNSYFEKERLLVKLLCVVAFCMTCTMLVSPNFPPRSSFPGMVQLVIASSMLLRIQSDNAVELIKPNTRKLLLVLGTIYAVITVPATFYGFYDYHVQVQKIVNCVRSSAERKSNVIIINSLQPVTEVVLKLSGYRLLFYKMSDNENDWRNVAFARYYGIKGIRMTERVESKNSSR